MKKLIFIPIFILLSIALFPQSPGLINYQTIIRNANGLPLQNKTISIRFTIYQNEINGTLVFQEHHDKTTNTFGLVNLEIGNGENNIGDLSEIEWAIGPYFLEIAVDSTNMSNYFVVGTSQLLSVPYALHANTVTNVNDADADPTNEYQNLEINGHELSINNGNTVSLPNNDLWNSNGNAIFYNNGNIGIGTSAPDYTLMIQNESFVHDGRTLLYLYNPSTDIYSSTSIKIRAGYDQSSVLAIGHTSESYSIIPNRHNTSNIWNKGRGLSLRSTNTMQSSIRFETNINEEITERMRIDAFGNIGIATDNPQTKLHIAEGDVYLEDINSGIIMKSPDGQCWKITINNDGSLNTESIECP